MNKPERIVTGVLASLIFAYGVAVGYVLAAASATSKCVTRERQLCIDASSGECHGDDEVCGRAVFLYCTEMAEKICKE